jgi:hypothetical protein
MKKYLTILIATILCLGLASASAQFGFGGQLLHSDASNLEKLLGNNQTFSSIIEIQFTPNTNDTITVPGKIAFDSGKIRFEVNLLEAKGLPIPPDAVMQMKSMGLDRMIVLVLADQNPAYLIYPGLNSYVKSPLPVAKTGTNEVAKIETTELGTETVDGHPSVKNKVVVTDGRGAAREFTVWNATDLKNFPVKIFHVEQGSEITVSFTNISLTQPDPSTFQVPAAYTGYDNMQTMIQTEMMKKMTGGMGLPPNN